MSETVKCIVTAEFVDRRTDPPVRRSPGGPALELDPDRARRWETRGIVTPITGWHNDQEFPWCRMEGRELRAVPPRPGRWERVVACLNIWNDLPALLHTIDSWYPHVDHVIAVDGAYEGVPVDVPWSTDGTVEHLASLDKVELVQTEDFWPDQCVKRSVYFDRAQAGDLLFLVDADEAVEGGEKLRDVPHLDVGWVVMRSDLYERSQVQPRLLRRMSPGLHYSGRHHWIYDEDSPMDNNLVASHQHGGVGYEHTFVPLVMKNLRHAVRGRDRISQARVHRTIQVKEEARMGGTRTTGHEPLRVLQTAVYDAGLVVYRLHSAINTTSPNESIMAIGKRDWLDGPRQFDMKDDRDVLAQAARSADVLHCHLDYRAAGMLGAPSDTPLVIHHHGTMFRENAEACAKRDQRAALRLVSNLELLSYGDDLHFLPNPVPVARYGRMANPRWSEGELRIGHSPSKPELKGTETLKKAVEILRADGIRVGLDVIHKVPHAEALQRKAQCNVFFDSFWLGIQCSGIEAAAMGMPVIAGDETVRSRYEARIGHCPYTFSPDDDVDALVEILRRFATSQGFWEKERGNVGWYVHNHHDYAAVARRYLELLDDAVGWRASNALR